MIFINGEILYEDAAGTGIIVRPYLRVIQVEYIEN